MAALVSPLPWPENNCEVVSSGSNSIAADAEARCDRVEGIG